MEASNFEIWRLRYLSTQWSFLSCSNTVDRYRGPKSQAGNSDQVYCQTYTSLPVLSTRTDYT